ncbi:hypothetical protein AAG906_038184 [Vitis piasezkii]
MREMGNLTSKEEKHIQPESYLPNSTCSRPSKADRQHRRTARLGMVSKSMKSALNAELSSDFVTYYYNQTLDHFNYRPESYTNFQQRYLINSAYWGGANSSSPIFVYTGDEASITGVAAFAGFMVDLASRFKGLLLIESMDDDDRYYLILQHRYYGDSVPFRSKDIAFNNTSTLGYFSSTQALADYAELITNLKKNLSAENCPVIAIGGSYGGMLASWFRLKYPHVVIGALASSETSETCYTTIKQSWSEIDEVAGQPNGLANLSQIFRTCDYPVTVVCGGIDGAPEGSDILSRIFAGVVAFRGNMSCYYTSNTTDYPIETIQGWGWQTCSEIVIPIGRGVNDTMFPPAPFNLTTFSQDCTSLYGVAPRPHWYTTYYGGHDIELILRRFASNIIFSNGLRDPYSIGGNWKHIDTFFLVLKNISNSVLAILTVNGSHCLDILPAASTDPEWLVMQRKAEVEIIEGWIAQYNVDLHAITK